jgi:FSR family fosmidomycin resistance protein-like MFS transporter
VAWPFLLSLAIFAALMFSMPVPAIDYDRREREDKLNYFSLIFALLFSAVLIRSLVGFALTFPWKLDLHLAVILTLSIVAGKALGGILADRFGWTKTAVGASLLALPLLAFGEGVYYLAIPGVFLFNMTMPITLTAMARIFPGRPAYAFGLTCLALILGAAPIFAGYKGIFDRPLLILAIILASASFLNTALQLCLRNNEFAAGKILIPNNKHE